MIAQQILSVDEFITAVHNILGPVSCGEPTNDSILEKHSGIYFVVVEFRA